MRKILLIAIAAILVTTLYACSFFGTPTPAAEDDTASLFSGDIPALSLTVQA